MKSSAVAHPVTVLIIVVFAAGVLIANNVWAQERTIWVPARPTASTPHTPLAFEKPLTVVLSGGSTHTLANARLGVKDYQYDAETMQMSQAEYDTLLSIPLNSVEYDKRTSGVSECYYSILIPAHDVSAIAAGTLDKRTSGFPIAVTLRDGNKTQVVGEKYGGHKSWFLYLTGKESLGGFGDQTVSGSLGPTNGAGNPKFVSITFPEVPVAAPPKERSNRVAVVTDVSSGKHSLSDVRVAGDKLVCGTEGGSVDVPIGNVARITKTHIKIDADHKRMVWTVTLKAGESREFNGIGIIAIGGKGPRFYECIPVESIASVDFAASHADEKK